MAQGDDDALCCDVDAGVLGVDVCTRDDDVTDPEGDRSYREVDVLPETVDLLIVSDDV